MPKVAASAARGHRPLLVKMSVITLLVDALALIVYLPLARPLTQRIFGADYLVSLGVSLLLSLYMISYGIHGLITAVFVGSGKPQFETASRIVELILTAIGCWALIPAYGGLGAAVALLAGKAAGLFIYFLFGLSASRTGKGLLPAAGGEDFAPAEEEPGND
jgi:O-antigen/teichoic acid export membrane protein